MKEKMILILMCIITVFIIAVISLDCGCWTGKTAERNIKGLCELIRRVQAANAECVLLIDPGHGGMDGGASSSDGTLEKDINLAIATHLAQIAEQYNCSAILTREDDEWLCRDETGSIRSRKTADLMARREMIRKYSPDITVSIHLNSFKEDPRVKGAQVFYPASGGAETVLQQCSELAGVMQKNLNEKLQKDDPRTAMTRDGVFIFKEVKYPIIIIECGFMSNPDEADRLNTDRYQQELAQCIMDGIAEYTGLKKPANVEIVDSLRRQDTLTY